MNRAELKVLAKQYLDVITSTEDPLEAERYMIMFAGEVEREARHKAYDKAKALSKGILAG